MKYKRCRYGYKVCYRENGTEHYIRCFKTYTYSQAVDAVRLYIRYPPTLLCDEFSLNRPKWKIIPINRKEVKDGIWREVPF